MTGDIDHFVDLALQRPINYPMLSPEEQWEIDNRLGLLDWEPTEREKHRYHLRIFGLTNKGIPPVREPDKLRRMMASCVKAKSDEERAKARAKLFESALRSIATNDYNIPETFARWVFETLEEMEEQK